MSCRARASGTVMGHELVGTVVEVDPGVSRLETGDRVVSPVTTSSGGCAPYREDLTTRCIRGQLYGWVEGGLGLQGAQAELVRVPLADGTLVKIPPELPALPPGRQDRRKPKGPPGRKHSTWRPFGRDVLVNRRRSR